MNEQRARREGWYWTTREHDRDASPFPHWWPEGDPDVMLIRGQRIPSPDQLEAAEKDTERLDYFERVCRKAFDTGRNLTLFHKESDSAKTVRECIDEHMLKAAKARGGHDGE